MDAYSVALRSARGDCASLEVSRLPSSKQTDDLNIFDETVTVREARTYRYRLCSDDPIVELQPAELFDADDVTQRTGRLMPGEAVGLVTVEVTLQSGDVLRGRFDVRPTKLADEQAFAAMLADLARLSVEALHQGFAPSAGRFSSAIGPTPRLLYQQFAILHALMTDGELPWALSMMLNQPHRSWETELEPRQPGRRIKGSSRLSTQMSRPGSRVPTPNGPLESLPSQILIQRTDETLDTLPNRYVRFVLERWRAIAATVLANADSLGGAARRRGLRETERVLSGLDETLSQPLFREVGRLSVVPGDNQVLRRREGYRQIAAAAALVDASLGLDLDVEDPFLVSRKSVATLYEYWTFVRLARAAARAFDSPKSEADLWKPSSSGMSLILRAGASTRLEFVTQVGSRSVRGDLFFNREFRAGGDSWSRSMRPDASLVLRVPGSSETWLHFDAKYKVDWERPFESIGAAEEEEAENAGVSTRADLLKMHAYRDAIRNSAGSYVLFPGSQAASFAVDQQEFLPGLGAFPMRPTEVDRDEAALVNFLSEALQHVAAPGTRHRRATYWTNRAYEGAASPSSAAEPPAGALPPADTPLLLAYVRSDEQWTWIRRNGLYNLRSGGRPGSLDSSAPELDASLLLLYGRENGRSLVELHQRAGPWQGVTTDAMRKLGYPHPHGDAYLVATLQRLPQPQWLEAIELSRLLPPDWMRGRPYRATWLDLVLSAS